MPHVIHLHSALTEDQARPDDRAGRRQAVRASRIDIGIALGGAGLVNMAMLAAAAMVTAAVLGLNGVLLWPVITG